MRSFITAVIALAAFASAIPFAARDRSHGLHVAHDNGHHAHAHAHAGRHGLIAGRSVSYDGSCGSWSGASCPAGFCCGSNGWCGNAAEHCGAGCQADFGQCGSAASPASSASSVSDVAETQIVPAATSTPSAAAISAATSSPVTSPESTVTSPAASSTTSVSISLVNKAPGGETRHGGRPSYGGSPSTMITKTAPSAEPTSSVSAQPSAPAYTPPASSESSDEPATSAPSSSAPAPTSATSTDAGSAPSTSYGSATPSATSGGGGSSQGGAYIRTYKGDGSASAGWPTQNDWLSFDTVWENNQNIMKSSCSNAFSQVDNTEQELADVKSSIEDISSSTGVDKAFILAIMLQESNGCVRAPTTSYSHANPGLFQSNQGSGSCNDGSNAQNPCPESEIHQMIEDGVAGTTSGDGLEQLLGKATGDGAQKFYEAARMYNSGSIDASGNLGGGVATHCYCSDIANRLTGWYAGVSSCDAGSVGA